MKNILKTNNYRNCGSVPSRIQEDLNSFRSLLLEKQYRLTATETESVDSSKAVQLDQTSVGRLSRMDAMQSQAMALETKRRRKIELSSIEAALERIDEGEYGHCACCEEEINRKRLEIDPATPFCVECAAKV